MVVTFIVTVVVVVTVGATMGAVVGVRPERTTLHETQRGIFSVFRSPHLIFPRPSSLGYFFCFFGIGGTRTTPLISREDPGARSRHIVAPSDMLDVDVRSRLYPFSWGYMAPLGFYGIFI